MASTGAQRAAHWAAHRQMLNSTVRSHIPYKRFPTKTRGSRGRVYWFAYMIQRITLKVAEVVYQTIRARGSV